MTESAVTPPDTRSAARGATAPIPPTAPTTTRSGASPSATSGTCSSCSSSRAPRPACRGRRSCASARATGRRSRSFDVARRRGVRRRGRRAAARRPGHRPQPGEGRRGDRQRPGDARPVRRGDDPRGPPVVVHRRHGRPERVGGDGHDPGRDGHLAGDERGPPAARLPVRRADDLLRADAVGGARQRPPGRGASAGRRCRGRGAGRRQRDARQASRSFIRPPVWSTAPE